MARRIVENKVQNQIALIRSFRWNQDEYDHKNDLREMERVLKSLKEKRNLQ